MSDFNTAINLGIRITEALNGIQKVEKQIAQLATKAAGITLDIGGKAATGGVKLATRNVRDYINTLGTLDRKLGGLGGRLKDVAKAFDFGGKTVVGVAGINALAAALSKLPGYLTGGTSGLQSFASTLQGLTSPINSVVEGLQSIGPTGLAAAGGIATATAAFMAFGPGIRKATKEVNDFKNSFKLGTLDVTQDLISEKTLRDALRSATSEQKKLSAGTAEYTSKTEEVVALQRELTGEIRRQEIIYKRVNAEQLAIGETVRRNIRESQASRGSSGFSDAETARRDRRAVEGALRRQGLVEKEAIGPASQLGSLDADVERLRYIKQQGEETAKQIAQEEQQRLSLLDKIQSDELTGSKRLFDEKLRQINLLGEAQLNQTKKANQADLDAFDRKLRETERFRQSYDSPAGPGNPAGERVFRQERDKRNTIFGDIDRATTDAVRALTDVNKLGKQLDANKSETARRLEDLEFQKKLDSIEEEAKAQLKADRLANKANERDFDRRLKARETRRKKNARVGENLALGAGFPLLFGAGPGGVAGGVAGALVGGDGFGLQILLSALGTRLDELGTKAIETAKALKTPLENFDQINEQLYLFDRAGAASIKRLQELGRSEEALARIRAKLDERIGTDGVQTFAELEAASKDFNVALSDLSTQLQLFVAGPLTAFLKGITEGVKDTGQFTDNNKRGNDLVKRLGSKDANDLLSQIAKARTSGGLIKGGSGFGNQDAVSKVLDDFEKRFPGPVKTPTPVKLTPEQELKDAEIALSNAEKAESLRKRGIDLERQVSAFRRSNEDTIYGFKEKVASIERQNIELRRSVENQIFSQRQALAKQESDNIRKQQQLEIDRQDLALSRSRTFTNAPGEDLANSLSDAVRQYVKTRAEGEADLQQKERNFTLETIELEKRQKDFELQVQQKIDAIKRTITQYERSVTKYKLDVQIQIDSLQRSAADYQLEKAKERIRLESDHTKRQQATEAAAEMVRSGNYGAGAKYMQGNIGPTSTGPHFDIKRRDGSFFTRTELDKYVQVNGMPLSSGITVPGGEFGASRSYGSHKGWDYAFGGQAALTMKGGAQFMDTQKTAHGDATAFMTPDGQVYQILHGTFVPPTQAEKAATAAMPAMPAAPTAPGAPGVTDVSALTTQSAQLNQALIDSKQSMLEIEASAKALADDQAVKRLSDTIAQSIQSVQAPLDNLLQTQQARFEDEKSYARLLQEGIAPAVAQQTVEIERQVATQLQQLDAVIARAETEIASLKAKELETGELEKQLELLKAQRGIIEGKGQSAISAAATNEDGKQIREYMNQLQGELNDTDAQIVSLAQTVTDQLGTAMSDAITGLIDGTTTVEEAFSNMFANIGKAFIDMATKMLAQQAVLALLKALTGGIGGGAAAGAQGIGAAAAGGFLATGGTATGGQPYIVGEEGPELFIPGVTGTVSNNDQFEAAFDAMSSTSSSSSATGEGGLGGSEVSSAFAQNNSTITSTSSYMKERAMERESQTTIGSAGSMVIETQVINNVEYATVEQMRLSNAATAKQARAQVFADLKNKPSARAAVGMR